MAKKFSLYPVDFEMNYIHTGDRVIFRGHRYIVGKINLHQYTLELWTGNSDVLMLSKTIHYPTNSNFLLLSKLQPEKEIKNMIK